MNLVSIMGVLSAFAFLMPVAIIAFYRLLSNSSLIALFFYFLLAAVYNLINLGIIAVPLKWEAGFHVIIKYLNTPLMLMTLRFFCTNMIEKRRLDISLVIFIVYELVIMYLFGFNSEGFVYIIGPGILMMLIYSCYFFSTWVRAGFEKKKGFGKTYMITSILFANGCYAMVYCFHYFQEATAIRDVFLIYHIASLLASVVMSIGLYIYTQRVKQVYDVLLTRKELQAFFDS